MKWKKIVKAAIILSTVLTLGVLCYSQIFAQVCVPYIPTFAPPVSGTRSGVFADGGPHCTVVPVSHNFGVLLAGEPIVALQGFRFRFTGEDHHFLNGIVEVTNTPVIAGAGMVVQFDVRVCFNDSSNNAAAWDFTYVIAAWPQS